MQSFSSVLGLIAKIEDFSFLFFTIKFESRIVQDENNYY